MQITCIVAILRVNHYWWKNNLLGIEHNYLSCSRDEQPLFNKITSTQTLQLICYFYGCIFENGSTSTYLGSNPKQISVIFDNNDLPNLIELICLWGNTFKARSGSKQTWRRNCRTLKTAQKTDFLKCSLQVRKSARKCCYKFWRKTCF